MTGKIETIYKLSPLQEGMLFQALLDPESDVNIVQFAATLRGNIDPARLREAWRRVTARHGMLRTSFHWKEVEKPVQVVHAEVELPWTEWSGGFPPADFAAEEIRRGFALDRPPLFRLALLRTGEDEYRFLWTIHHLILDGWSLHVVLREVFALYRDLDTRLPEPRPFSDYLKWLKRQPPPEPLPRPASPAGAAPASGAIRPAAEAAAAPLTRAEVNRALSADLTAALERLARSSEVTLNTVTAGAWALLLSILRGEDDVTFGSVVSGRPAEIRGIESMVGMFINTVPVQVSAGADETVESWLRSVQRTIAEMRRYEHVSLAELQRGRPPFDSIVVFENYPADPSMFGSLAGIDIAGIVVSERTNYPLTLTVVPGPPLRLRLGYDAAQYDAAAAVALLQRYEHLLAQLTERRSLREIEPVTAAERERILVEWNDTARDFGSPATIHALFEEQAARTPDRVAVRFAAETMTFRELDERAREVARGIRPGSLVGVSMKRSPEMIVALLGILKAGAAYVPLDPAYPADRIAFMCEDAGVELILEEGGGQAILPVPPPRDRLSSTDLAYVIYTSGSTGKPKGVQGLHSGAVNRFRWMWELYPFSEGEVHAQKTSLNFLDSLWEIFGPLLQGVPIAILDDDTVKDPRRLVRALDEQGVTRLVLVPSLLRVLVDEPGPLLPKLRICVTSGEALPFELWQRFRERMPHALLLNLYGSSEVSADATYEELHEPEGERVPIGRPIANMRACVLDRRLRLLPPGVKGELFIGGAGLARGYHNRPELTAERFLDDPFRPGERLFRTGDLASWRPDGRLDFLGRADQQVKVRGFRVELGEIEAALREHPAVSDAVVVQRDDALVAYVVGEAAGVSEHLRRRLPEYMLPSRIVALDAFPLTPSGKLDRNALPAPGRTTATATYVPPRTRTEEKLAGIFAAVLGIDAVGADDDFFELGGHSLLATQVVSRIRHNLGVDLPVNAVFEACTVARLAGLVAASPAEEQDTPERLSSTLSFAQQRLWFLDQIDPGNPLYNVPTAVRIGGALDHGALRRTLSEIVRRHEALRTRFVASGGRPEAIVAEAEDVPLPVIDVADEAEAFALARDEALQKFDLARDTLFRAKLLRFAPDDHLLVATMHHVASDGWSIGVLLSEFAALYDAFSRGEPSPLPELPMQYGDFARWQRERLTGGRMVEQLDYWRRQLDGAVASVDLPTDRPRPPVQTYRGAAETFLLPAELLRDLLSLGRAEGTTLFMTLMAAFQTLLHRYSRQDDLSVGTPVAGRTRVESEALIGFFINTLVIRARFDGDPTFRELLARVREAAVGAYAHQDVPFEKLVEELRPERDLARQPFFQVMFVLQNEPMQVVEPKTLTLRPQYVDTGLAKFDLTLQMTETAGGLDGLIEYNTDLFDRGTIQRLVAHFETLLRAVVRDPSQRVSRLPLLTDEERQTLLLDFNDTARDYDLTRPLHALIEEQARRTPDAVAVTFEGTSLTYAELDARANALAATLQPALIPVSMERSLELVVMLLAILKAGGAYVPIDPGYPEERKRFMLDDVSGGQAILPVPSVLGGGTPDRQDCLSSTRLAYVIYTSGSTGTPKGAMNAHRGIVNRLLWMQEAFRLGPGDVVAQKTPFSFDVSVWEFFWPLIAGARLAVAPPGIHRDPAALAEWIAREQVSVIHFVPPMLQAFLQHATPSDSLRLVICSGEALPRSLADELFATGTRAELHNLYGPTECAVDVTHAPCVPGRNVTIGRPIANTRLYVLEPSGEPAPIGVPGELHIGGVQVGVGYLNRPELTAEKFIPDAFVPGARLYRTGDLARWLPDGTLNFLGRLDHQVKLRGFRIELGEIETAIREHPGVRDAVVVKRDDALVAYVVPRVEGVRERLRERLPEYMVPAAFVFLDALPLTPNGKVDRRALPAPTEASLQRAKEQIAPRTPTETKLAELWRDLLHVEHVGTRDDFFALGGHSLLATRLVARVRDAFGVDLPLRSVFTNPVLEEMARVIDAAGVTTEAPIVPIARGGDLPLSFIQERLWFLDQFEPGTASLHIPLVVRVRGPVDVARLQQALDALVARHESLRTNFRAVDGVPRAIVVPHRTIPIDLVDAPPPEASFDLGAGPLLRVALQRVGDDESILYVTIHHIVADGWSLVTLLDDLDRLYQGGGQAILPVLKLQYADFAAWQRERVRGELLERQLDYWKRTLDGAPPQLELPLDHPRPPVQTYRGARVSQTLDAAPVERLAKESGATPFMVLLAAFELVLSRWSGQEDVVVGAPVANRPSRELEAVVGPFLNSVVLRTRLDGNPTFRELLARVREAAVGAFHHADVPFEKVLEALQPERDLSRTPLFQLFFNLLNFPLAKSRLGQAKLEIDSVETPLSKFDLTVYIAEHEGTLRVDLVYNADLFDEPRMLELQRQFALALEQCLADPDRRIGDVSLVTDAARAVLPDPAAPLDDTWRGGVHELFAGHARRHPGRLAVVDRDTTMTYRELDEASDAFAAHLRKLGTPVVALYGRRCAGLVVNVLGALKAGVAITILDPSQPRARNAILWRAAAALPLSRAASEPPHSGIAVITFTSGSTGIPKAVAGRHLSLTHFTPWQVEELGLTADDRFTMLSGIAHDPLQRDIFTPLQIGATICIPDPDRIGEPGYLLGWAARERVTVAHLTPAMIQLLADSDAVPSRNPGLVESLRVAMIVGDVLTRDDVRRLRSVAPNVRCINFYGSTETQRAVGWYPITNADLDPHARLKAALPLGRGIPDVQLVLRNAAGQLCGVGEVGEVYVRSPHLAAGYLNDEALTRERFLGDSYRTGDLAHYRPDGNAEWVARADRQVKVRGFRIELGEIEAALRTHPDVREAVVMAADGALVAYVVGNAEGLRDHVRALLPEYMVPADFVVLDRIPLTANRKIDRAALPKPVKSARAAAYLPPRDVTEIELTRIWEEVLGRHPVGIRDDFFALGGHSLLAVRLLARVEQHFGRKLPLVTFFQRPTVEKLAIELRGEGERARRSPLVTIQDRGDRRPFFCVHPVGGTVLCYRTLAARLGEEQPFLALEAVGVDGDRPPLRSIEAMAEEYLRAMRARQPHGPYLIGGWSFGGLVAFDMARQLRQAGEEVLTILLDTWTPGSLGDFEDAGDDATILRLLARALGDLAGRDFFLATEALRARGGRDEQLAYVVEEAHRLKALPPDVGVEQLRPLFGVVEANLEARRNYRPQPLDAHLVLFKAEEALIDAPSNETLGWNRFAAAGLDVHVVSGDHNTMLAPPHVDTLVERLMPYLHSVPVSV